MEPIKIPQGETKPLTERVEETTPYQIDVEGANVRLGKTETRTRTQGQTVFRGDRARVVLHPDEELYAYAEDGAASVEIRPEGFDIDLFPRRSVYEIERVDSIESIGNLENHDAVQSFTHDPNADGSVPSNDVPPGIEVVVQASFSNDSSSHVKVGNHELGPGDAITLRVTNTDVIDVSAPTTGDVVNITWEA